MTTKYFYRLILMITMISTLILGAAPVQVAGQSSTPQLASYQESVGHIPIHGRVLNMQAGLRVQALNSNGERVAEALIQADGYFFFKLLPDLFYRLEVLNAQGQPLDLEPGVKDVVSPDDPPNAEYVLALAAMDTHLSLIPWQRPVQTLPTQVSPQRIADGNTISGTVKKHTDYTTPISGVIVNAYVTKTGSPSPVQSATTAVDGTYTISGLTAGTYYVGFFPASGSGYANQYYDDKLTLADAIDVTVTNDYGPSYITAYLSKSGGVSGTVTGADNSLPVSDVHVSVYTKATGNYVTFGTTDASGKFSIMDLDPGSYVVQFDPSSSGPYRKQYYDNKPTLAAADSITVAAAVVPNINVVLALKPTGGISGKVSGADGAAAVAGVSVFVTDQATSSYVGSATTAVDGTYTVSGLDPGTYVVDFYPSSSSSPYREQYFNNKLTSDTADSVVVAAAVVSNINAVLALKPTGGISGKVSGADGAAAVAGVSVSVTDQATSSYVGSATTAVDGTYTISGLDPGTYVVDFDPPSSGLYHEQYFNNKLTRATADSVVVAAVVVSNINAVLALKPTGGISGMVTAADTSAAISDVRVSTSNRVTGDYFSATTAADGTYTITGLDPGFYVVDFDPPSSSKYVEQFYNNKPTADKADPVQVVSSIVPAINAVLAVGGSIAGKVTDMDGLTALEDVNVVAWIDRGCYWSSSWSDVTDASGTYSISSLPAGKYVLEFEPRGKSSAYLDEYYNHKKSFDTADQVTVTSAAITTINTSLTKGGVITGKVTAADTSAALKDVYVYVYDQNNNYQGSTTTDANGLFSTPGLVSGTYYIEFSPSSTGAAGLYISEYYNKKAARKDATGVVVTAPNITTNINAALTKGASISGKVSAVDTTNPLASVSVAVYDKDGYYSGNGYTNSSGNYTTTALPSGNYRVNFSPSSYGSAKDYVGQYYQNKTTLADANPVTVTVPSPVTGINASLARGGSISGTVFTLVGNKPIYNVEVNAYNASNQIVKSLYTNTAGAYQIPGLSNGSFRVRFILSCRTTYLDYYNKKGTLAAADPVSVISPNDTPNINGYLNIDSSEFGPKMLTFIPNIRR